jgi:ubiquinone/menaquinone biosynthesis C-methylase UbiE
MLPRTLEPEVMDTREEAVDYDAMDHSTVNAVFVDDFLAVANNNELGSRLKSGGEPVRILDVGTGTAQIPIALCHRLSSGDSGGDGMQLPVRITAIDLAAEMLAIAERNIVAAGFEESIIPEQVDAKALPFPPESFDVVFSNSIVHHIPACGNRRVACLDLRGE